MSSSSGGTGLEGTLSSSGGTGFSCGVPSVLSTSDPVITSTDRESLLTAMCANKSRSSTSFLLTLFFLSHIT